MKILSKATHPIITENDSDDTLATKGYMESAIEKYVNNMEVTEMAFGPYRFYYDNVEDKIKIAYLDEE